MRVMWIPARHSRHSAPGVMQHRSYAYVERLMHLGNSCVRVFITSHQTHLDMRHDGYADRSKHWTISACNKQYCSLHTTPYGLGAESIFLGCMKQVDAVEAMDHVLPASDKWYLLDQHSNLRWIPVAGNPNKVIPTQEPKPFSIKWEERKSLWASVEKPSVPKPGDPFPVQERPWPLKSQTYEQWKSEIIDAMNETLAKHL